MPSSRVPGPLGLETDPFPGRAGPWERWPLRAAVPAGPAADAHYKTGPVSLDHALPPPGFAQEEKAPAPIERFRYMEVQEIVVKVRCVPLWQPRFAAMLGGTDEDSKLLDRLERAVRAQRGGRRGEIVAFLKATLSEEGRSGGPTWGRVSALAKPEPPEPEADEETDEELVYG